MSSEGSDARKLVAELENIEFNTGSDIRKYTDQARKLSKALAMELEYSAQELEAALKELPPGPGESRLAMRRKGRSVAKHLKRAAEAQRTVGVEAVRTWGSLTKHFERLVKRKKRAKTLNLDA